MKALEDVIELNRIPKLLSWVDYRGENGCWNWLAGKKELGYGAFVTHYKQPARSTHVIFYEMRYGEVPKGLHVDHTCRNTSCVNPKHLEAVTCKVNVLRGVGPTAENARKTNCGGCGREYDGIRKGGGRTCSYCLSLASRRYRARKKSQ